MASAMTQPFLTSQPMIPSPQVVSQGFSSNALEYPRAGGEGARMEFADVLEQTIALLQRQGRISYGALKRRFQLDDAYLEDLKVELIEAQQLARDENGRILVWTGAPAPPPAMQADQRPQGGPAPSHSASRTLNGASSPCCSAIWWARHALSSQLDPEDYRDVVQAYQEASADGDPAL